MFWIEYTLHGAPEAEDALCGLLAELGVESLEIEGGLPPTAEEMEEMFADSAPELQPDELPEECWIRFYLHPDWDRDEGAAEPQEETGAEDDSYTVHDRRLSAEEIFAFEQQLRDGLAVLQEKGLAGLSLEIGESREEDWRDAWKKYYKPQQVGGFLIRPGWEEVPEAFRTALAEGSLTLLTMEPGTAFGTGGHASTRILLRALEKYLQPGDTLLDIGTGSGILAIGGLLKGASFAAGTELDPAAAGVVAENLRLNSLAPERFLLVQGNVLNDGAVRETLRRQGPTYRIVLANILAPVIEALAAPGEADSFAPVGGLFLASGIIDTRLEEVLSALAANPAWELLEVMAEEEWRGIAARRVR